MHTEILVALKAISMMTTKLKKTITFECNAQRDEPKSKDVEKKRSYNKTMAFTHCSSFSRLWPVLHHIWNLNIVDRELAWKCCRNIICRLIFYIDGKPGEKYHQHLIIIYKIFRIQSNFWHFRKLQRLMHDL